MRPYYQDTHCTIYHGDCREILPQLEPVGAIITDPPYGVNIAEWDFEVPHTLLTEFLRLTCGAIVWFGAAPRHQNDLLKFNPSPQRIIIWAPSFSLSKTMANGIAYRWHPIYLWQLPKKHDGPTWDVINDNTEGHNWWKHSCTKPLSLMSKLCGFCEVMGIVLDPSMGSGTTLVAAKNLGRKAIGIEIEEKYCEIAVNRLRQDVLPLVSENINSSE